MTSVPIEYQALGVFVRETRRELGVGQGYVAERTEVTAGYISQVETGKTKPSDGFLQRLEVALELRPGTLFLRIGKPPLDLLKALLQPADIADASGNELVELTRYLTFLRLHASLQELLV